MPNIKAINATAQAIYQFEGGSHPLSRNNRNNNPGNLRPYAYNMAADPDGYRTFLYQSDGWNALEMDISVKVTTHVAAGTMLDFFNLYAPGADHNDPHGYAQFVCGWLSAALDQTITLATPVAKIFM